MSICNYHGLPGEVIPPERFDDVPEKTNLDHVGRGTSFVMQATWIPHKAMACKHNKNKHVNTAQQLHTSSARQQGTEVDVYLTILSVMKRRYQLVTCLNRPYVHIWLDSLKYMTSIQSNKSRAYVWVGQTVATSGLDTYDDYVLGAYISTNYEDCVRGYSLVAVEKAHTSKNVAYVMAANQVEPMSCYGNN